MTLLWGLLAQAAPEPGSWIAWLEDAGTKGALLGVIYMLATRRWITRGTYDELRDAYGRMEEDRNLWRDAYLGLKSVTETAVDVVKKKG